MFCVTLLLAKVLSKVILTTYAGMLIALLEFECEYTAI